MAWKVFPSISVKQYGDQQDRLSLTLKPLLQMNDVLDDLRPESAGINERNLLGRIWLQPQATLTYILQNCPRKHVNLLLFAGGTTGAISNTITSGSVGPFTIVSILLGGLFGLLLSYLFAWILNVTGKWLGGQAKSSPLQTVLAWSEVPMICSLFLLVPELLFSQGAAPNSFIKGIWDLLGLVDLALIIWSIVLLIIGIALVQGFSFWRALGNLVLAILLMIMLAFGLFLFIDLFIAISM